MFGKFSMLSVLPIVILGGFSRPFVTAVEKDGNPWWIWILIFFALVAFVAFVLWWWMRSTKEEEEEPAPPTWGEAAAAKKAEVVAPEPEIPPASPVADDLKRVEGIGPKISSVLQAAGITTFSQLADTDVDRLQQILETADPNLLRLADPTTWPEQARLAADGDWEALKKLQDELKGGKRA
jgi:predicted flap endonuclease-1-like 5' DNA nuclease